MSKIEDAICSIVVKKYVDSNPKETGYIVNQITERASIGFKKYGVTMEREDLSIIQWIIHLEQELMDALVYCQKLCEIDDNFIPLHKLITDQLLNQLLELQNYKNTIVKIT